jgi:peroxiredoxin Q/BCP
MGRPDIGKRAPDFDLESDGGERVTLEALRGRPVVLYFYPKDDTPGCTRQACTIRDTWGEFERAGIALYGVSPDSVESHGRFKQKYELPFPLLADPDHAAAEAYGVWVEKQNYGRRYFGVERSAFVIDAKGRLAAARHRIAPEQTATWALEQAARLTTPA